jgi:hypothetical protein
MWRQLLFWAIMGPKHFRGFVIVWLLTMAFFFYCFVHEAFDGSAVQGHRAHVNAVASR